MHLLTLTSGNTNDQNDPIDLNQSPAEIVFLSSADTENSLVSTARKKIKNYPKFRVTNLINLSHNMSVDLYINKTLGTARVIVVRILGGKNYWPYGIEQLNELSKINNIKLILLPGDDKPDNILFELSNVDSDTYNDLWSYFNEGGLDNTINALQYLKYIITNKDKPPLPKSILPIGIYWPNVGNIDTEDIKRRWVKNYPLIGVTFYRALFQSNQTSTIDRLILSLRDEGFNSLPLYAKSFKDKKNAAIASHLFSKYNPDAIINLTGFSLSSPNNPNPETIFDNKKRIVFQSFLTSMERKDWVKSTKGLNTRDIAMNVSLPEIDGRIITKSIAFKKTIEFDEISEAQVIKYQPDSENIRYISALVSNWIKLQKTHNKDKKIFITLANYPNKDGRIGNGVGLDTPASTINVLKELMKNGYKVDKDIPKNSKELMNCLLEGTTNNLQKELNKNTEKLSYDLYLRHFNILPKSIKNTVLKRWGRIEDDPYFKNGSFNLPIHKFKNISIGIQPARGYNIDPKSTYHSPDLVPPHNYLAFYIWIKHIYNSNALIQMGKHGNLEWLPGKSMSLSKKCYPELILGPMPLIYPFIVNDPGEGSQAKRRNAATIIDHLTPPLTRAEIYGDMRILEVLIDEYYEASQYNSKRMQSIAEKIIETSNLIGLTDDCGVTKNDTIDSILNKIDTYLCELKELQIRDGLHIFGESPKHLQLTDLTISLTRLSRKDNKNGNMSLLVALTKDLKIKLNPLECDFKKNYTGEKPKILESLTKDNWRSCGDTIERLEKLSKLLVSNEIKPCTNWKNTMMVLEEIRHNIMPSIVKSGKEELKSLIKALDGLFIKPGPSGAPTRGKIEVIPTGKNFYSLDSRTLPTQAAWSIGMKSAKLLVEDYRQKEGKWPTHFALSAWGTSNMRTGGDDIAQAMALIGAKPKWDISSGRVSGFEIIPTTILGRPRVDVTLRVSGFFRDAFPNLIELFDSAIRKISELKETNNENPISKSFNKDITYLIKNGLSHKDAKKYASYRIFSSMPGSYGAGLQTLIDESIWDDNEDFANSYMEWSSFAYGKGSFGEKVPDIFSIRLQKIQAIIQNQDNREHDILDSDDYYQFQGGLGSAVKKISGKTPIYYHNDHSRPEKPVIRSLDDEISRVVRGRATNPKWIAGVMRHGYKGAFELSATLDYLFAFQATTGLVKNHHFDLLFNAYIEDKNVYKFIKDSNIDALNDIKKRFIEALDRKLWHPKRNDIYEKLNNN